MSQVYELRTLKMRDAWPAVVCILSVFFVGICLGNVASGWLIGMSLGVILIVGQSFTEARRELRYWLTLGLYAGLHVALFAFAIEAWIPKPTAMITPHFLIDYLALGWAFPKISGLCFDLT